MVRVFIEAPLTPTLSPVRGEGDVEVKDEKNRVGKRHGV
jgi:hypothetical protein